MTHFSISGLAEANRDDEDAAEHQRNEPDGEAAGDRRETEHAGRVAKEPERADQEEIAKRRRRSSPSRRVRVGRQETDATPSASTTRTRKRRVELFDRRHQPGEQDEAGEPQPPSVQVAKLASQRAQSDATAKMTADMPMRWP